MRMFLCHFFLGNAPWMNHQYGNFTYFNPCRPESLPRQHPSFKWLPLSTSLSAVDNSCPRGFCNHLRLKRQSPTALPLGDKWLAWSRVPHSMFTSNNRIQGVVWKVVVTALLADLIIAIPLLMSYNLFLKYMHQGIPREYLCWYIGISRGYRILLTLIPFTVFLFLFYQLGTFLPLPNQDYSFWRVPSRSLTEECVLRVGAMGVTLMAVLSGFGSICAGWDTYLAPTKLVTEADVMRAKMSLQMTQDLIADKQQKIEQIEGRIHEKVFLARNRYWL